MREEEEGDFMLGAHALIWWLWYKKKLKKESLICNFPFILTNNLFLLILTVY